MLVDVGGFAPVENAQVVAGDRFEDTVFVLDAPVVAGAQWVAAKSEKRKSEAAY